MGLVFEDGTADSPATHALVIGVGGYPHLVGGADEREAVFTEVGLLKQLTSPPRSAVAFAQWLMQRAAQWKPRLATVDLLVSPHPDDAAAVPPAVTNVKPATMDNIDAAYGAWRGRCNHEENAAVFYFCGHGVEKKHEQILLAEDFGANNHQPWRHAFAFTSTRLAFHECKARTQCFFIDACRNTTSGMLRHAASALPLEPQDLTVPECAFNLTMQATAKNEKALGPPREVSYFTQALIRAFDGAAGHKDAHGNWIVNTGNVAAKITEIMRLVKDSEGFRQRCATSTTDSRELVQVEGVPNVALDVACNPDAANRTVRLSCVSLDAPGPPLTHSGAPWAETVPAGVHRLTAEFPEGDFRPANETLMALPPTHPRILECGP